MTLKSLYYYYYRPLTNIIIVIITITTQIIAIIIYVYVYACVCVCTTKKAFTQLFFLFFSIHTNSGSSHKYPMHTLHAIFTYYSKRGRASAAS